MKERKLNNEGFSLIELIVVIAIMAILVGSLAPQFIKYIESSRQSTDIQNASAIRSAIEAGVADGTIEATDSLTSIVVSVGSDTITVSDAAEDALKSVGLSKTVTCKSKGWGTNTAVGTYSLTDYKWTAAKCENTKDPKKDLSVAFQ